MFYYWYVLLLILQTRLQIFYLQYFFYVYFYNQMIKINQEFIFILCVPSSFHFLYFFLNTLNE